MVKSEKRVRNGKTAEESIEGSRERNRTVKKDINYEEEKGKIRNENVKEAGKKKNNKIKKIKRCKVKSKKWTKKGKDNDGMENRRKSRKMAMREAWN